MFARYKSSYQILSIMFKMLRFALPLILALFVLSGCRKQPPTPVIDSGLGSNNSQFNNGDDIMASGRDGSWGTEGEFGDTGLEPRDDTFGINASDNTYGDYTMYRGQLDSVYFGFDSSSISASERFKLQATADHLSSNSGDAILIEGRCDWYGTTDYNLALGERRANSARDYLLTLGVRDNRINTLSKGSLEATSGLSKSESGQDRRAELIILKK
ncbi:MAG: peptidoglycan-associated lipoprotein [Lentimonas sp.]|jgi:peptidoglycan-associated lipoprotein